MFRFGKKKEPAFVIAIGADTGKPQHMWNEIIDDEIFIKNNEIVYTNFVHPLSDLIIKDDIFGINTGLTGLAVCKDLYLHKNINTVNGIYCWEIEGIKVEPYNLKFSSKDGILYNKNKDKIICYPQLKIGKEYKMENNVIKIEKNCFFNNSYLKKIVLSENCEIIGDNAFLGCKKLEKIYLPKTLTDIGINMFLNCNNLKEIYYDGTKKEFEMINGYEQLIKMNIIFNEPPTLEDLIEKGKSMQEINKILKKYEIEK